MVPKGDIRNRLLADASPPPPEPPTESASYASSRGIRRRVALAPEPVAPADQPLMMSLKRDWDKGKISAKQVQDYAHGDARQGAHGMCEVAAAGTHGRHPQDIQRSLLRLSRVSAWGTRVYLVSDPDQAGQGRPPLPSAPSGSLRCMPIPPSSLPPLLPGPLGLVMLSGSA